VRVAVVDTYYQPLLEDLYGTEPQLADRPYEEQLARLIALRFGTADAYSRELRALGHDAWDLVANCVPLQRAWAREHGGVALRLRGRLAPARILEAQLDALAPDVVYFQALSVLDRAGLDAQRAKGRLVAGQIASGLPPQEQLEGFDLILTSFPHWVERLRARGIDTEYLPIGFDTAVLAALAARGIDARPEGERPHGVAFVGSVVPSVHGRRVQVLERLSERVDLAIWGYGAEQLPAGSPLHGVLRGHAWGLDMYAELARARIALNAHIDLAEGYANNMRLFEATGVGALLVTDAAPNLGDFFAPGQECVTYDDLDELPDLLEHWLADDARRVAVATAGHERTLREHTYADRIRRLAGILEARIR
jgi:spore maturation protein CgeB